MNGLTRITVAHLTPAGLIINKAWQTKRQRDDAAPVSRHWESWKRRHG